MYIYNVTINIQEEVHHQWLDWMKQERIPKMLKTGKFSKALMTKVQVKEEMGGITYSIQYFTQSREMLHQYYKEDAAEMQAKNKAFEGKFVAFSTELKVVMEKQPAHPSR